MQVTEKPAKISSYQYTDVIPDQSIKDIDIMLQRFGVGNVWWNMINPEDSFILFESFEKGQQLIFKVVIPYVTNSGLYNKPQSLRILYHKIKALLIDLELGSKVYEIFANNLVISWNGSQPISIGESSSKMIEDGNAKNIYLPYKQV